MGDPVREALRVAQKGICCWGHPCQVEGGTMKPPCCSPYHMQRAAITIAAFLRALPHSGEYGENGYEGRISSSNPARNSGVWSAVALAAAVEEAARDE